MNEKSYKYIKIKTPNGIKRKKLNFPLGSIVRVIDCGEVYSHYKKAFAYFNMNLKEILNAKNEEYLQCQNVRLDTNWVVINAVVHEDINEIIYHIKNKYNEHLVIGKYGIQMRKMNNKKPIDLINSL